MGIVNGNYKYFNIDSIKDKLLNSFSQYYGEEYREFIDKKFNACDIHFYHSFDYVKNYYDKYIKEYETEIIDLFYKEAGLSRNKDIMKWLEFYEDNGTFNKLRELFNILICGVCNESADSDFKVFEEFKTLFGFKNLSTEDCLKELIKLNDCFYRCVEKVKSKNPCDVFNDVTYEQNNINEYSQKLLLFCYENKLVDFTDDDIETITKYCLNEIDLCTLDCYGRIFYDDLTLPGLIDSFSSKYEKILQEEDNPYMQAEIYYNRLQYMALSGSELKYIERDELFDSGFSDREDYEDLVLKEYNYQTTYCPQYMVDSEVADRIENMRKNYINHRYLNLKCYPQGEYMNYETNKINRFNYCHLDAEQNNDLYDSISQIYMLADDNVEANNNQWYLIALIHELNHNLGSFNVIKINDNKHFRLNGLTSTKLFANSDNKVFGRFDAGQNTMSEEYINQQQAEEIYKIYISHYNNPKFFDNDDVDENAFASTYNDFEPILGDFYRAYKQELKKSKVHDNILYEGLDFPEYDKEILSNFINIADDLYQKEEQSEFYDMFTEDIRNELIDNMLTLRKFLKYGVTNNLFDPQALINFRETDMGLKDKLKFKIILNKIYRTMKKVGIKKDCFKNNLKYNIKNKLGTLLKTEMTGAIDYSKMWELDKILEEYRNLLNKYGIRGVFNLKDKEELNAQMKAFLSKEDYEYFKALLKKKDYITRLMIRDKCRYDKDNQPEYYDAEFID